MPTRKYAKRNFRKKAKSRKPKKLKKSRRPRKSKKCKSKMRLRRKSRKGGAPGVLGKLPGMLSRMLTSKRPEGAAAVEVEPGTIITDVVREVNKNKEVVWEWNALDHLDPRDPTLQIHECFSDDHWPMINGLYQMENGLVLMSLRTCSGVIAVEKRSGAIKHWINYPDVAQQHCPFETKAVIKFFLLTS